MKPVSYDKEKAQIELARLKKGGQTFEIVVDPDQAIAFKEGKTDDIKSVVQAEHVYFDAKKGELAAENIMENMFKTTDPIKVAEIILKEGEIQLTSEYREKLKEEKRKKIINIIQVNGVDPRTHLPHPLTRIEAALEEAKVKIDNFKKAEDQVQDVIKQIRPILPISFELKEISIKIGPNYAAKSYSTVEQFGKILRDEWQSDGSWLVVVEIPAGLQNDLFDKLNDLTHGEVETKILKEKK
jgi:ribosome maturation protein SDO1